MSCLNGGGLNPSVGFGVWVVKVEGCLGCVGRDESKKAGCLSHPLAPKVGTVTLDVGMAGERVAF